MGIVSKNVSAAIAVSLCITTATSSLNAAQNCIVNGDFEATASTPFPDAHPQYEYANGSSGSGTPPSWTLSPTSRTGLINSGTECRKIGTDLVGIRSLYFERKKNETAVIEANQQITIPAPGRYLLSFDTFDWNGAKVYPSIPATAELISNSGITTNNLLTFTPNAKGNGPAAIRPFCKSVNLTSYGAENPYTVRFFVTTTDTENRYSYCIIDNVEFKLRTLILAANETFTSAFGLEPYDMVLKSNSVLTYQPASIAAEVLNGKVMLSTGAKIAFDMSNATLDAYILRTDGFTLYSDDASTLSFIEPANILSFIELTNAGDFTVSLIEDGKTILIAKPSAVYTSTWTGGGDAVSLLDAANWSKVPDASTLFINLGAAADWRGLDALTVSPAATLDMNGFALKLSGLSTSEYTGAKIVNSGTAADLTIDVANGENINKTIRLDGNIRLVKEGSGNFRAAKQWQSYYGGTAINAGAVKLGKPGALLPFGAGKNLIVNGDFANTPYPIWRNSLNTDGYVYPAVGTSTTDINGWAVTVPKSMEAGLISVYQKWSLRVVDIYNPFFEAYGWSLFLGANSTAKQTFTVAEPGTYRLSLEYAPLRAGSSYAGVEVTATVSGNDQTITAGSFTPVKGRIGFQTLHSDIEITNAGEYTLNFVAASSGGYAVIDNVRFERKCEITVGEGATLNTDGRSFTPVYGVVLSGGTLKNGKGPVDYNNTRFSDVKLTANSTIENTQAYGFSISGVGAPVLDLDGKTNTVSIANSMAFTFNDAKIANGTLDIASGGWLTIGSKGVDATNADFVMNAAFNMNGILNVRNYTAKYTSNNNTGTAALNVYGVFKPESDYFYGCTMQNDATIDLSDKTTAWSTTSLFTDGKNTIEFLPNTTINIEIGDREIAEGDQLISWTDMPTIENLVFALVRNGVVFDSFGTSIQSDGLYVKNSAVPAYAIFDTTTSVWKFYTTLGSEIPNWDGGVTSDMQVRFSTFAEYEAIIAANVNPGVYMLTGNLVLPNGEGEIDMTALPFEFPENATIDLNGRTVKLSEAVIGSTRAFTVTSSVSGGVLVADVKDTVSNTAMTLMGNLKLLKTGSGTLIASKAMQKYTGGTEVTNGVLKCALRGDNMQPFGPSLTELVKNGNFDANTSATWSGAENWNAWPGRWCGCQPAGSYSSSKLPVGKFAMIGGSQTKAGNPAQFWQDIEIAYPGRYCYSFDHARRDADYSLAVDVLLIHGDEEQLLTTVTPMTVDTFTRTTGYVDIPNTGTYTLKFIFHRTPSAESKTAYYNIFDNISFALVKPEIRATGTDAVIDMNGQTGYFIYNIVLDGGVVANTGDGMGSTVAMISSLELSKDSTLRFDGSYGFVGKSYTRGDIQLDDHTLTVDIAPDMAFTMCNMNFDQGKVVIPSTTGKMIIGRSGYASANGVIAATNVDFSIGCALRMYGNLNVKDYVATYEGTSNGGTAAMNVFGTFKPCTPYFYGCTMQDGATLDLTAQTDTWNISSAFTEGSKVVTFADNATIYLKPGAKCSKIVSWETKPANYDTLTFALSPEIPQRGAILKKDDGIYYQCGFTIVFR